MSHRADATRFLDNRGYSGHLIRGQAPYLLVEEGVRNRVVSSYFFKEQCFGLNEATLCDRAVELTCVGGTYAAGTRATPFICLAFKMLQLGVARDIVDEYLRQEDFKYLRALAAFYVRLTEERSEDVYRRLEPLLTDKRKLRRRGNAGFALTYMDEFVDSLLTRERVCATSFWKLVPRSLLEDEDKLEERVSPLAHMLESDGEDEGEDGEVEETGARGRRHSSDRSRAESGDSVRSRSSSVARDRVNGKDGRGDENQESDD